MTMLGLCLCLYMTISVCLRFDVRGELTVDVAYSLLSSRLEHLEVETFSIKTSMTNIEDRIDQIEMLIKSQLPTNTHVIEVSEVRHEKVELKKMNRAKELILNAFASEKVFIRNALTENEEQFTELRKSVYEQMNLMNKSMENDLNSQERTISSLESNQASDISSVRSRVDSLENKRVGFTARLMKHLSKYARRQKIVFDNIKTNYGGGYSSSTGIFTAPKSGLYLFQFNVEAYQSEEAYVVLYVNGNKMAEANVNNGPNFTGSNAAVAYMDAGQQAYVRTARTDSSYGICAYRTSFTGVLIN